MSVCCRSRLYPVVVKLTALPTVMADMCMLSVVCLGGIRLLWNNSLISRTLAEFGCLLSLTIQLTALQYIRNKHIYCAY